MRARDLSGEHATWYVYRDGTWRPPSAPWWTGRLVPHVVLDPDGWITEANAAASSLLGMDADDLRHFTDFVAPGATDDATMLFAIVAEGHELSATVLLRPHDGDVIACELRAERTGQSLEVWLRLAEDVESPAANRTPSRFLCSRRGRRRTSSSPRTRSACSP